MTVGWGVGAVGAQAPVIIPPGAKPPAPPIMPPPRVVIGLYLVFRVCASGKRPLGQFELGLFLGLIPLCVSSIRVQESSLYVCPINTVFPTFGVEA